MCFMSAIELPGELLLGTVSGSASALSLPGWKLLFLWCLLMDCRKRQAALAGYKFLCLCSGSPSADAECKKWSSSCQLPSSCSFLHPKHRGTWAHLCPHCAQWRPLGQTGGVSNFATMFMPTELKVKFSLFPRISCHCALVYSSPPPRVVLSRVWGLSAEVFGFLTMALCTQKYESSGKFTLENGAKSAIYVVCRPR